MRLSCCCRCGRSRRRRFDYLRLFSVLLPPELGLLWMYTQDPLSTKLRRNYWFHCGWRSKTGVGFLLSLTMITKMDSVHQVCGLTALMGFYIHLTQRMSGMKLGLIRGGVLVEPLHGTLRDHFTRCMELRVPARGRFGIWAT